MHPRYNRYYGTNGMCTYNLTFTDLTWCLVPRLWPAGLVEDNAFRESTSLRQILASAKSPASCSGSFGAIWISNRLAKMPRISKEPALSWCHTAASQPASILFAVSRGHRGSDASPIEINIFQSLRAHFQNWAKIFGVFAHKHAAPGPTKAELALEVVGEEAFDAPGSATPIRRVADPSETGAVAAFKQEGFDHRD
jgi:hypothetical protein